MIKHMSYTILYRSMFAKVGEDRYIPMIEVGDSNCYEGSGRYERRCRDWVNWRVLGHEEKLILSQREIMQGVYKLLDDYNTRYVNKPIHGDEKNGYWTYKSIEQNFGWLSGIAISGKHTTMTTARMVANFFNRGFEQAANMHDVKYWGHFPIRLCYWENGEKRCFYYDTFDEFLEDIERRDGTKYRVEYLGVEPMWDYNRNRRNR